MTCRDANDMRVELWAVSRAQDRLVKALPHQAWVDQTRAQFEDNFTNLELNLELDKQSSEDSGKDFIQYS